MTIKRILCLLLAVCVLFTFAACGGDEEEEYVSDGVDATPDLALKTAMKAFKEGEYQYNTADGDYNYDIYSTYAVITGYYGNESFLVVPAYYEGLPVLGIADNGVFSDHTEIKEVHLPKYLMFMGGEIYESYTRERPFKSGTFQDCTNLETVSMGMCLQIIGENAFNGCTSLKEIKVSPNVTGVGFNAFRNCTALTALELPETLETIGDNAFEGCTALTGLTYAGSTKNVTYGTDWSKDSAISE